MCGEDRPATVSQVFWTPEATGKCPDCGRDGVQLGRVNLAYDFARRLACIHCHFGPPDLEDYGTDDDDGDWDFED
jgi:hypothetical protein